MSRLCIYISTIVVINAILPLAGRGQAVYDLANQFSESQNPNGPWSFNEGTNPLPFVLDTSGGYGPIPQPAWSKNQANFGNSDFLPVWFKAANDGPTLGVGVSDVVDWKIGDIVTHVTGDFNSQGNGLSNVTWTSPKSGRIEISGSVWLARDIDRTVTWMLSLNSVPLANGTLSDGDLFDRANPFAYSDGVGSPGALSDISIVPGDVLKLEFDHVGFHGDFVGVNLTISHVPEPASIVLLAVCLSFAWKNRTRLP